MSEFSKKIKNTFARTMESIGNAANKVASNTRTKINEMNLVNERKEILDSLGMKAYTLWQNGAALPDEIVTDLKHVQEIELQLTAIREDNRSHTEESETPELIPKIDIPEETKEEPTPTESPVLTVEEEQNHTSQEEMGE